MLSAIMDGGFVKHRAIGTIRNKTSHALLKKMIGSLWQG